jgi:hypothetical protein
MLPWALVLVLAGALLAWAAVARSETTDGPSPDVELAPVLVAPPAAPATTARPAAPAVPAATAPASAHGAAPPSAAPRQGGGTSPAEGTPGGPRCIQDPSDPASIKFCGGAGPGG